MTAVRGSEGPDPGARAAAAQKARKAARDAGRKPETEDKAPGKNAVVPPWEMASEGIVLVDTHAHIDGEDFDGDREEMLARAKASGVAALVTFGDTLASSARAVELAGTFENVYAGVGVHPENAFPLGQAEEDRLAGWTKEKKVAVIGEIGLDYYWEKDEDKRALQRKMFVQQLALARDLDLPVCIHDREAHGDLMKILKTEGRKNRGVVHCFSGSWEMAKELLKLGWYLGVDGPLTYKNAAKLPEIVAQMPADRLLVETDCPYLSPLPYRGRRNEPAYVRITAECAANIRGETLADFCRRTTKNACEIYPRIAGTFG